MDHAGELRRPCHEQRDVRRRVAWPGMRSAHVRDAGRGPHGLLAARDDSGRRAGASVPGLGLLLSPAWRARRDTPSASTSTDRGNPSDESTKDGMSTGTVVGIGIGAALGGILLAAVAIVVFLIARKRNRGPRQKQRTTRTSGRSTSRTTATCHYPSTRHIGRAGALRSSQPTRTRPSRPSNCLQQMTVASCESKFSPTAAPVAWSRLSDIHRDIAKVILIPGDFHLEIFRLYHLPNPRGNWVGPVTGC